MRALSVVWKKGLLGVSALALILFVSSRGEASVPIVIVDVTGGDLDASRVREAVGRELGAQAIGADDPRAASASGRIAIDTRGATLTVTYRRMGAPEGETIARSIELPSSTERAESSAVILAGNVARDEASDLLAAMRRRASKERAPRIGAVVLRPLSPPAPEQEKLATLEGQVSAYEKGAKDYRETVAQIVRLRHEAKKKEILAGMDCELAIEKAELVRARAVAIKRLEELLAKYEGQELPELDDAKGRLAALYAERARSEAATSVTPSCDRRSRR